MAKFFDFLFYPTVALLFFFFLGGGSVFCFPDKISWF